MLELSEMGSKNYVSFSEKEEEEEDTSVLAHWYLIEIGIVVF